MWSKILSALVGLIVAGMVTATDAAVIYSQALVNPFAGFGSNDPTSANTNQRIADDFLLGLDANIAIVTWWGLYTDSSGNSYGGISPQFSIRFFNCDNCDAGGGSAPVTDPFVSQNVTAVPQPTGVVTSSSDNNHAVFAYTATLPSVVSLVAGTYWLSIVESDIATTDTWEWVPTELGVGTAENMRRVGDPLSDWISAGGQGFRPNQAFVLEDASVSLVPEPSTLALLGLGLSGLGFSRRKRAG